MQEILQFERDVKCSCCGDIMRLADPFRHICSKCSGEFFVNYCGNLEPETRSVVDEAWDNAVKIIEEKDAR